MTVDFALHCCAGIRVAQHYPENANSISLTIERKGDNANVTLFGLPPAVTDKLVGAFGADVEPVINGNGKVAQLVKAAQAAVAAMAGEPEEPPVRLQQAVGELERALQRFPEFAPIEYRPGDLVAADCACGEPVGYHRQQAARELAAVINDPIAPLTTAEASALPAVRDEYRSDTAPTREPPPPPDVVPMCEICGHPMPPGEEMFKHHGFSGPCPTDRPASHVERVAKVEPSTDGCQ